MIRPGTNRLFQSLPLSSLLLPFSPPSNTDINHTNDTTIYDCYNCNNYIKGIHYLEHKYPHRQQQIKQLMALLSGTISIASSISQDNQSHNQVYVPSPIFCTGSKSTGKTTIVCDVIEVVSYLSQQKKIQQQQKSVREVPVHVQPAYVDCSIVEPSTIERLVHSIYKQLRPASSSSSSTSLSSKKKRKNHSGNKIINSKNKKKRERHHHHDRDHNSNSNSKSVVSRSVETLCDHIEYIITRQRRSRRTRLSHSLHSSDKNNNNNNDEGVGDGTGTGNDNDTGISTGTGNKNEDCSENSKSVTKNLSTTPIIVVQHENNHNGTTKEYNYDYRHNLPANHQRDPPPIDLFDLLLNELQSLTLCCQ
mmetsp:Transcript_2491/g.2776  ORF Transcript_2491/g.2776 Transcript_2491/m.2776 type:complete len:363 (+) Transcript_2491:583-1671(+)